MRIAVTGATGFIGRHTMAYLVANDHEAVPCDSSTGCDVCSTDLIEHFADIDAVIHLAGVLGTSELFDTVQHAVNVNITGTLRVLEACAKNDVAYVGITMPDCWPSVYQATKLCAVRLAHAYHHHYGFPVTHIRAFNAYGADQAVGPGHPQKIVPTFAYRSWRGEAIPIWGEGDQTVDLVHVDHIAHCLGQAATQSIFPYSSSSTALTKFGKGQVWDAGTGKQLTVLQVAHMVMDITGNGLVEFLPMRSGELPHTKVGASDFGPLPPDQHDAILFNEAVLAYK